MDTGIGSGRMDPMTRVGGRTNHLLALGSSILNAEDFCQLRRNWRVELRVGTRFRRSIRTPPFERSGMTKAVTLKMVVRDLGNKFRPQRRPAEILSRDRRATLKPDATPT